MTNETDTGQLVPTGTARGARLDDRQARLVDGILSGKSDQEALADAGYVDTSPGNSGLRSNAVQAELREAVRAKVKGSLLVKALKAVEGLLDGEKTPAATKLAAAKLVIDLAGVSDSAGEGEDVPLHEMTAEQLERFMHRAQQTIDAGGERPVIAVKP